MGAKVGEKLGGKSVDVSRETIRLSVSLRLAVEFLHVIYIKYKEVLVYNLIFHLLWTGRVSSVSSLAIFRVP